MKKIKQFLPGDSGICFECVNMQNCTDSRKVPPCVKRIQVVEKKDAPPKKERGDCILDFINRELPIMEQQVRETSNWQRRFIEGGVHFAKKCLHVAAQMPAKAVAAAPEGTNQVVNFDPPQGRKPCGAIGSCAGGTEGYFCSMYMQS
jgi:hypothetical protein